jgi:hypothetical protein
MEIHQYNHTVYEEHFLKLAFQTEDCRDNVASPLALYLGSLSPQTIQLMLFPLEHTTV